jgi:hypothetical protein
MPYDAMLGELVRQKTRWREQQDERQQDEAIDDGGEDYLLPAIVAFENGVLDDDFMSQVDKRVEKHHVYVGYKAFLPETHVFLRWMDMEGMLPITSAGSNYINSCSGLQDLWYHGGVLSVD